MWLVLPDILIGTDELLAVIETGCCWCYRKSGVDCRVCVGHGGVRRSQTTSFLYDITKFFRREKPSVSVSFVRRLEQGARRPDPPYNFALIFIVSISKTRQPAPPPSSFFFPV